MSWREEVEILQLYVELESLRFYDTFEFKLNLQPGLDLDEYKVQTLLLQPFVENAIWHGLLHREGTRKLSVQFNTNGDDQLICTIEDNGIGREEALRTRNTGFHTGKGMSSSKERLVLLKNIPLPIIATSIRICPALVKIVMRATRINSL
ncbi:MAG: hypothetical protein KDC34_15035 [Saprospiraceae bacterium]|nr:hypothetical protein [Saprospiraceae bacterium]